MAAEGGRAGFEAFAKRAGLRMTCRRIDERPDRENGSDEWNRSARHFRLTLSRGSRRMVVFYSQGSAHTKDPTIADLLNCLASDFSGFADASSFEAWAGDFGYDPDSRKAERMYRAIERQFKAFERLMWDSGVSVGALYACEGL